MTNPQRPDQRPTDPRAPLAMMRSLLGAFLGIAIVGFGDQSVLHDDSMTLVTGAFGATAVLLFAAPNSPFSQPWNVIVGHIVSALVGVAVFHVFGANWFSAATAVTLAIAMMQLTGSIHPPGGASALIAVLGAPDIHGLGFGYALFPVGLGALTLVAVAWVTNNVGSDQRWPVFWHAPDRISRLFVKK